MSAGSIAGGTTVHISGANLSTVSSVTIGGNTLTRGTGFNYLSPDIVISTPAHAAGAVSITVTTVGGSVTATNIFTYAIAPTITALSPATGPSTGGTSVNISGTNLLAPSAITVGGIDVLVGASVTDTMITITTPANLNFDTGTVTVAVTANGITASSSFVYVLPLLTVSSVTLNPVGGAVSGPLAGGTQITINGSNFIGFATGAVVVTIGGVAATIDLALGVSSESKLEVTVPAGLAVGPADIIVTTTYGTHVQTVSLVGGFTYI